MENLKWERGNFKRISSGSAMVVQNHVLVYLFTKYNIF